MFGCLSDFCLISRVLELLGAKSNAGPSSAGPSDTKLSNSGRQLCPVFVSPKREVGRSQGLDRRDGRSLVILVAVLGVLAAGGYIWYRSSGLNGSGGLREAPLMAKVIRGPFDHIVLEQGEIESSSNIDVVNEVKSRGSAGTAILWVIDEGTYVKKGDKLVELDSSALEDELKRQRILVASAEAQVISSEATVRTNEIALQEYLNGTYLSERKAIESEIAVAEQELRKAELNLDSARRLAAKGMLKGLQIEAEEFAVSNARNVLESAEARLIVLDELTKEKNRVQLESQIDAAKAQLSSDQSVLSEEQSKQTDIEDQIRKCVILSPADGIVVYNNESGRRGGTEFVVEEGAIVRERQCIIKLPDPSQMQVKAMINESRIIRIAPGMVAKVRVTASPLEMLSRVKRVNKYAEPGSWFSSSVKQYAAFLEIIDPPETIRTGMSAEVRIFVEQLPDVLQVPVHGIYEFKNHHFCLVKKGDSWETREVRIGGTNEKMVTIDEGLEENEEIVLNPRQFLELMTLPEIEEIENRNELVEMAKEAPVSVPSDNSAVSAQGGRMASSDSARGRGRPDGIGERGGNVGDREGRRQGQDGANGERSAERSGAPGGGADYQVNSSGKSLPGANPAPAPRQP
jgi:HlyD family secretion protein